MAIIKKPIKKTLFYLSSLLGIIFALIAGLVFKNFQYNLSQLENKAKNLFKTILISSAKANCWTIPVGDGGDDDDGGAGAGGGCGDSCGGDSGCAGGGGACNDGDASGV